MEMVLCTHVMICTLTIVGWIWTDGYTSFPFPTYHNDDDDDDEDNNHYWEWEEREKGEEMVGEEEGVEEEGEAEREGIGGEKGAMEGEGGGKWGGGGRWWRRRGGGRGGSRVTSLVPRLSKRRGQKGEPGTHCLRMLQKFPEIVFVRILPCRPTLPNSSNAASAVLCVFFVTSSYTQS